MTRGPGRPPTQAILRTWPDSHLRACCQTHPRSRYIIAFDAHFTLSANFKCAGELSASSLSREGLSSQGKNFPLFNHCLDDFTY